ncbi:MAG TPA: NAD(P)/FAD-dependent oxidoreductase [Syntrophomonadaceae bacterium]|nr:NAD(P)/FAD-dependent oxidoreductase [Syntrophomonadaceae bacterium]HPR92638.1 NAD(P)/FAD-dependent oxidoreductase [Syntrophomonadaceae bacterium]
MDNYVQLFSPGKIGRLKIKNRVVMAPMTTGYASLEGEVTERLLNYYRERAAGGAGVIIAEAAVIDDPIGREGFGQICIDHSKYISGLARLASIIKAYNCRAFIQLLHAGRQTTSTVTGGITPVAPSSLPCAIIKEMPRELSITEIRNIIEKFVKGAEYAYRAGFDGVELHAAHGYLLNQFLSAESNQRTDEFGGSLENRSRILVEICRGIKTQTPDLALSVRLNIDDFTQGGLDVSQAEEIAAMLEKSGVDIINCSAGVYESGLNCIEPSSYEDGWRIYLAEAIKKKVTIPVMAGGIVRKPAMAEKIIAENKADFVFIGRSLLADSQWVNKARSGNSQVIRPCILCNNCIGSHYKGHSVSCAVNPLAGREADFDRGHGDDLSHIHAAVVGAGPAGMQAAIALRRKGITVTLYEKSARLGGMLNWAMIPPHKERIGELKEYLIKQLYLSGAQIILNHSFTEEDCRQNTFDYIIIAAGSTAKKPVIEGWNYQFCFTAGDIFEGKKQIKDSRVVIIGGGSNGCETADYLNQYGNQVIIIEERATIAADLERKNRRVLLERLHNGQVILYKNSRVVKIETDQVTVKNDQGEVKLIPAGFIIAAIGFEAENELLKQIPSFLQPFVFTIGDAFQPAGIKEAILQGEMVADTIIKQSRQMKSSGEGIYKWLNQI